MEGTDTLILLEEVLIGKSLDPSLSKSKMRSLHLLLISSPISVIRASGVIASRLRSQNKITEENHQIFSQYLKALQSDRKPKALELQHRGFAQASAQKAFSLIFGFVRLERNVWKTLNWSFSAVKRFTARKKVTDNTKLYTVNNVFLIVTQAVNRMMKNAFLAVVDQQRLTKGKFAKQRIKKKVVTRMIKFVKPSMDTISFWKWKIKVLEYNEGAKLLKTGICTGNAAIERGMQCTGWRSWKRFVESLKKFKFALVKRVLTNAEIRYFYLKTFVVSKLINNYKPKNEVLLNKQKKRKTLRSGRPEPASKQVKLSRVFTITNIRLKCLQKTSFTRFHFNTLLEETISQVDVSKVVKRKRKIFVPSGHNSRVSSRKHSRSNSLNRSFKFSANNALKPLVISVEVRFFFIKKLFFNKWKVVQKDESFSQEEHHHVIKRKRILSPKHSTFDQIKELEDTIDVITSKSVCFKGIPKNKKSLILRSAKKTHQEKSMEHLVKHLVKVSASAKEMKKNFINKWLAVATKHKEKKKMKLCIWYTLLKMANFQKNYFLRWKEHIKERKANKQSGVNQFKFVLRSMCRLNKFSYFQYFATWKEAVTNAKINEKKLKTHNKSLKIPAKKVLNLQNKPRTTEKPQIQAFNFYQSLSQLFQKPKAWAFHKLPITKKSTNQEKLKKMIKSLLFKLAVRTKRIFRPLRIIKNADHIKRIALYRLKIKISALYETFKYKWTFWKLLSVKIATSELFEKLKTNHLAFSLQRPLKRTIFKNFWLLTFAPTSSVSSNLFALAKKILTPQLRFTFNTLLYRKSTPALTFLYTLSKLPQRTTRYTFNQITKTRIFPNIGKSLQQALHSAFQVLKQRVHAFKLISKFNSAIIFQRLFVKSCKKVVKKRFIHWKTRGDVHKRLLARKYLFRMIFITSISEETAVWRWKYTLVNNQTLNPLHSLMSKRLTHISSTYQNRLKQFALFKLLMFSRLQINFTGMFPSPNSSFMKVQDLDDSETYDKSLNQVSMSSNFSSRITKDEMTSISRNGAVEVMALSLNLVMTRRITWAFTSIEYHTSKMTLQDSQFEDLIRQLNAMMYDKACLLEDNNSLRTHNEALIDSLERTNDYCNSLSLMVNEIQISKMVTNLKKILEVPLYDAFLMLKFNEESYSSF